MTTKCYIVELNSSIEGLYEDLIDCDFEFSTKIVDDIYVEISVKIENNRIAELEDIMQWYV